MGKLCKEEDGVDVILTGLFVVRHAYSELAGVLQMIDCVDEYRSYLRYLSSSDSGKVNEQNEMWPR
jgi:hypothetical protein